jgi:hypothetical protein
MVLFEQAVVSKEASKQDRVIVTAVDASCGTVFGGESMSVTAAVVVGSSTVNLPRMSKQVRTAEFDIASLLMVSCHCFVTKACARRPGTAASVERR